MKQELYELTNPQKPIWLTEQYFTDTAVNTICGYTFITDTVNLEVLKKAIYEMIKSNDGMRLKINSKNDNVLQYVSDFEPFYIPTVELHTKEDIEKKALEMASIPFIQSNEFLFQFLLFKLPNNSGGFIVNVHHLIGDSWSLGLIAKEVTTIYSELLANCYEEKNYPSYLSYIETEKNYKDSEKYLKDKAYWEEIFKTVPEVASLQTFKEEKKEISCEGKRERFTFASKDLINIQTFCDRHKISVYNFFMAIYSLYISKISNLSDFVIGTPILNRTNFDQKHTMGMFISVAPLRVTLQEETSFINFVKELSTNTMSIFRHQKYSYQNILEDIRKRDSSVPNLYNILLSYQITKTTEESNQIHYSTDWIFNSYVADELQIHLFDLNDEATMSVAYDYKASLFTSQEIANLHHRILAIIEQIISQENVLLKDISIVTPEEKHEILHDFNNTTVPYLNNKTIIDLFEEQVNKTPDIVAVEYDDIKISYRDLNTRVNQLCHYLSNLHLASTKNIGIFTNRTIDTIVGILAILKMGSTLVPIDPLYPEERIAHMIKTADLEFILSSSPMQSNIAIPIIDIAYSNYENCEKTYTAKPIQPHDNLYVIFTSGSTGTPKGLTLTHQNMVNLICFEKRSYDFLSEGNKILQFATMSFDVSYQEIFSALLSGATLVLIDEIKRKNMDLLVDYIVSHYITVLFIPPAYLRLLVEEDKNVALLSSTVKHIITAGESLLISSGIRKLLENDIELFNHYGPAETHVATTYLVPKDIKASVAPIGYPIDNSQIYILNNYNDLCPINVPGQIAISGDCVGNGYMNRPDLTQEKFIQDPFMPNQTMYLTGDIGFIDENHIIHYIGRNDFQVKINGFRIEPDEITKNILQYPNITSSCTIIKEYHSKKYIVSYYTTNAKVTTKELRSFLSQRLASYMMPYQLVELEALPINLNGKIDKKALPDIQFEDDTNFSMPQTDTEKKLLTIWQEVLQLSKISIQSNFFHLGGDSLLAIKLIALINDSFGINITINSLFKHPDIHSLANYLDMSTKNKASTIIKAEEREYYPLSSAQKRIYYTASLDTNSILYNIAGGIIIDKTLDTTKLQNCFTTLVKRHDALRTHFIVKNNDIVQVVDKKVDFSLELVTNTADNLNSIYADFVKPFDLSKAPLLRAKVVTLKDNQMLLLLDMHHIISDGTSLAILLQELCDLYNGVSFPKLTIDYRDFTLWEQEQFKTDKFREAKEFWVHEFQDEVPLLNMPTTFPRPSVQSFEGDNYYATLSQEVFDKVNQVAQKLDITPYMLLLSVYYILLSKYTSQDDIVVGTPVVGKEMAELSNVLGMFVNTLALRNKINTSSTFEEFSKIVKENCLNSFLNQIYPYDMLVKDLNVKREGGRNPLFDVMFIYQNNGYPKINFKDTHVEYFIPYGNIAKFDLSLEVVPIEKEYSLRFEYCTKLFDEDFIKRLSSHYIRILDTILANTNTKLADIQMMSQEEENQILQEFNHTKVDYPSTKTIIDLFEEQVQKNPNKIAVVFEDKKLTYQELNEKSNQLARYLIANHIELEHNSSIGIMIPRSLDTIILMLAILKIGASYVLIDINLPEERIRYMLNNSNCCALILTEKIAIDFNITTFYLNTINLNSYDKHNLNILYDADSIFAILYTSGSTGTPKGVALHHKGAINLLLAHQLLMNTDICDTFLSFSSVSFDMFQVETYIPLLSGKTIILTNQEEQKNPISWLEKINKYNINFILSTPSKLKLLLDINNNSLDSLKVVQLGGEQLTKNLVTSLRSCSHAHIYDAYGPSEITACCSCKEILDDGVINIGKPICNSKILILDNNRNLCPIGIAGELYIGGVGVSSGYVNNPTLTNSSFIYLEKFGEVFYKTGDIGYFNNQGEIVYIGRNDHQIKLRGQRVELSEIEAKILEFNDIEKCAVIYKASQYLSAFIVANYKIDIKALKNYLSTLLPNYMIPKYITQIDILPLNNNGKVDKKALENFEENTFASEREIVKPSNIKEELCCIVWSNLLGTEIGITDDIFEFGADSLLAIQFKIQMLTHNIDISYADVFKFPKIADFCQNCNLEKKQLTTTYDYSEINKILQQNNIQNLSNLDIETQPDNNILLLGSNGFVGMHIIDSFIKNDTGKIYCIVRDKNKKSAENRFLDTLHFYFGTDLDQYINQRIFILKGNVLKENFDLSDTILNSLKEQINVVINTAALVKHYGKEDLFKAVNVDSTNIAINFCNTFHKRLIHISSLSVSGNDTLYGNTTSSLDKELNFTEQNLYIGQGLDNLYIKSKFDAEHLVLENIVKNKLQAQIFRLGNITSRFSDGKFQINPQENAFANKISSFINLKHAPDTLLSTYMEFTPVDICADAIILLVQNYIKAFTVFHLYDSNHVYMKEFVKYLHNLNITVDILDAKDFADLIQNKLSNQPDVLGGIINDFSTNYSLSYQSNIKIFCEFTKAALHVLGFSWPIIDENYIQKYINYLHEINFWEDKYGKL